MTKNNLPYNCHHIFLYMSYHTLENRCQCSYLHIYPNNYHHKTLLSVWQQRF